MDNGMDYIITRLEAIDKKLDEKLEKILVQTTKTNGRVNALEEKVKSTNEDINVVYEELETLKADKNVKTGRDKTIWYVALAVAAIIGYYVSAYFQNLPKTK